MSILLYYKADKPQVSEAFMKAVMGCGVVFLITMLLDFLAVSYVKYLQSTDNWYWKYAGFIDTYGTVFQINYWLSRLSYLSFFIGLMPILLKKGKYLALTFLFILTTAYSIFNYFYPDTLKLQFTPEAYNVSCLIIHIIYLVLIFVSYFLIYQTSKDDYSKIAGRLLIIAGTIDIINIVAYAIMFTIDSSNFIDRFSSIIDLFKLYYSYMSTPIYIVAVAFLIYQIKKIIDNNIELI